MMTLYDVTSLLTLSPRWLTAGAAAAERAAGPRGRRDEEQDARPTASQPRRVSATTTRSSEVRLRTLLRHVCQGPRQRQVRLLYSKSEDTFHTSVLFLSASLYVSKRGAY